MNRRQLADNAINVAGELVKRLALEEYKLLKRTPRFPAALSTEECPNGRVVPDALEGLEVHHDHEAFYVLTPNGLMRYEEAQSVGGVVSDGRKNPTPLGAREYVRLQKEIFDALDGEGAKDIPV